jgi:hypothetical protein
LGIWGFVVPELELPGYGMELVHKPGFKHNKSPINQITINIKTCPSQQLLPNSIKTVF